MKNSFAILLVSVLLSPLVFGVTVGFSGSLAANGYGGVTLNGTGTFTTEVNNAKIVVQDINTINEIQLVGNWSNSTQGNSTTFEGSGNATMVGTNALVTINGTSIKLKATGYGQAILKGKGNYKTTKKLSDVKVEVFAPAEVKLNEEFEAVAVLTNKGNFVETGFFELGFGLIDQGNCPKYSPTIGHPFTLAPGELTNITLNFSGSCGGEYLVKSQAHSDNIYEAYPVDNYAESKVLVGEEHEVGIRYVTAWPNV